MKKWSLSVRLVAIAGGIVVIALLVGWWYGPLLSVDGSDMTEGPALSALAVEGKTAFAQNCVVCHGVNGAGTDKGPPLIHKVYNPGHHSDEAFYRAVAKGSPQHHWRFGNMPPQPHVARETVTQIIAYVRALQIANGIEYERHRM
jgi:mono/diheme cytochrome c family protein